MKNFRLTAAVLVSMVAVFSCGKNTSISGVVEGAQDSAIVLKKLDGSRSRAVDTLRTDSKGAFSYSLDLQEPEFMYLYYGDRQIASMIICKGDRIEVATDTLGAYRTEGSQESVKLQKVENAYNAFLRDIRRILSTEAEPDAALSRRYVEYYRDRVRYVMENSHSLSVVPVFFQSVNENLPVFDQPTDGIIIASVADSLKTVYPESRYIKVLAKEAEKRMNIMKLNERLRNANQVGYFDIELPGMEGSRIKLSDHISEVTLLWFWSSTASQKMFNQDALIPLYNDYHSKGLEIYAVALDADKTAWASAVKSQKLPWVNVCDTRAEASPYVGSYGVTTLPMVWIIVDGEIDAEANVSTADDLRAYLSRKLK